MIFDKGKDYLDREIYFVRVSEKEALTLIKSLTSQLLAKDPNVSRDERFTSGDLPGWFTIMVDFTKEF